MNLVKEKDGNLDDQFWKNQMVELEMYTHEYKGYHIASLDPNPSDEDLEREIRKHHRMESRKILRELKQERRKEMYNKKHGGSYVKKERSIKDDLNFIDREKQFDYTESELSELDTWMKENHGDDWEKAKSENKVSPEYLAALAAGAVVVSQATAKRKTIKKKPWYQKRWGKFLLILIIGLSGVLVFWMMKRKK